MCFFKILKLSPPGDIIQDGRYVYIQKKTTYTYFYICQRTINVEHYIIRICTKFEIDWSINKGVMGLNCFLKNCLPLFFLKIKIMYLQKYKDFDITQRTKLLQNCIGSMHTKYQYFQREAQELQPFWFFFKRSSELS